MITIKNLTKRYSNNIALDGISCSIPDHSICALVGPNGAGKSTLLKILTRILSYDRGIIDYGASLDMKTFSQNVSYLPEQRGLYTGVDIETQLVYFANIRGTTQKQARENVDFWLKKFNISNWKHRLVSELSKGMQQKVQFMSCLVSNPTLLFMDEPFSGVDPVNFRFFMEILQDYQKSTGATTILSTHNMKSVEDLCSDVILLHKGRIEISGDVNTVRKSFSKENTLVLEISACDNTSVEDLQVKLGKQFRIISSHLEQGVLHMELSRPNSASMQTDMTQALELLDGYEVNSISRKVLSMEDIFIQLSNK